MVKRCVKSQLSSCLVPASSVVPLLRHVVEAQVQEQDRLEGGVGASSFLHWWANIDSLLMPTPLTGGNLASSVNMWSNSSRVSSLVRSNLKPSSSLCCHHYNSSWPKHILKFSFTINLKHIFCMKWQEFWKLFVLFIILFESSIILYHLPLNSLGGI